MYMRSVSKPDGRSLRLYSRRPILDTITSPPSPEGAHANSHMRWHPLRREWVAYAQHRQGRTFLPPAEHNPLAPSNDPNRPSELPVLGFKGTTDAFATDDNVHIPAAAVTEPELADPCAGLTRRWGHW